MIATKSIRATRPEMKRPARCSSTGRSETTTLRGVVMAQLNPHRCADEACGTIRRKTHANAFCTECFEPKFCSISGQPERLLKCKNCAKATPHAVIGTRNPNDVYDLPQLVNEREKRELAVTADAVAWFEGVYRHLGIEVMERDRSSLFQSAKDHLFSIGHELRDGQHVWTVEISDAATPAGRLRALQMALTLLTRPKEVAVWRRVEGYKSFVIDAIPGDLNPEVAK